MSRTQENEDEDNKDGNAEEDNTNYSHVRDGNSDPGDGCYYSE